MAKDIELGSKDGTVKGAMAEPPGNGSAKMGGVVVVQEWQGINGHMRSLVDRFASAGYLTVAPDLFHGKVTNDDAESAKLMHALDFPRAVREIGASVQYLKEHSRSNGKIAVVGFCMGGALAFLSAANIPGLAGVVAFYGLPDAKDLDVEKITAPILAHFASKDGWAKPESAKAIQDRMGKLGKPMTLHVYDAGHAFMRDTDPTKYDDAAAKLAWSRTMDFLKKQLP